MGCNCNKNTEPSRERLNTNKELAKSVISNSRNKVDFKEISIEEQEKLTRLHAKNNPFKNLFRAAKEQEEPFKWFLDGASKIIKCLSGQSLYSDEDIQKNRDVCRTCEYSTKNTDGKLTLKSQCMAPNPMNGGAPCACFITCKTQEGKCPLNKWTHITINYTN